MVQGLDDWSRRWLAVPERVRENLRYEMEEIAEKIVAEMYGLAPHLTGDLAASIGWTWGDAPAGSMVVGTVGKTKYAAQSITIYAGNENTLVSNERGILFQKAKLQEFGTKNMPANPFFFPIWRLRRRSAKSRMTRAMTKAIREV